MNIENNDLEYIFYIKDILSEISKYLPRKDILSLSLVSHYFHSLAPKLLKDNNDYILIAYYLKFGNISVIKDLIFDTNFNPNALIMREFRDIEEDSSYFTSRDYYYINARIIYASYPLICFCSSEESLSMILNHRKLELFTMDSLVSNSDYNVPILNHFFPIIPILNILGVEGLYSYHSKIIEMNNKIKFNESIYKHTHRNSFHKTICQENIPIEIVEYYLCRIEFAVSSDNSDQLLPLLLRAHELPKCLPIIDKYNFRTTDSTLTCLLYYHYKCGPKSEILDRMVKRQFGSMNISIKDSLYPGGIDRLIHMISGLKNDEHRALLLREIMSIEDQSLDNYYYYTLRDCIREKDQVAFLKVRLLDGGVTRTEKLSSSRYDDIIHELTPEALDYLLDLPYYLGQDEGYTNKYDKELLSLISVFYQRFNEILNRSKELAVKDSRKRLSIVLKRIDFTGKGFDSIDLLIPVCSLKDKELLESFLTVNNCIDRKFYRQLNQLIQQDKDLFLFFLDISLKSRLVLPHYYSDLINYLLEDEIYCSDIYETITLHIYSRLIIERENMIKMIKIYPISMCIDHARKDPSFLDLARIYLRELSNNPYFNLDIDNSFRFLSLIRPSLEFKREELFQFDEKLLLKILSNSKDNILDMSLECDYYSCLKKIVDDNNGILPRTLREMISFARIHNSKNVLYYLESVV